MKNKIASSNHASPEFITCIYDAAKQNEEQEQDTYVDIPVCQSTPNF